MRGQSNVLIEGGSNVPKKVTNHYPEHLLFQMDSAQDSDLAPFLGDMSQSEKLSEIKPPLADAR